MSAPSGVRHRVRSSFWFILTTLPRCKPICSTQALGNEMMNVEPPVTCTFLSSSPELDDNVNYLRPIFDLVINIFIENIFN